MPTMSVHFLWYLLISFVLGKEPQIHSTAFEHLPRRYSYFDDSSTILYLDEGKGIVYRSQDDGREWKKVDGPTDEGAQLLILHPFEKETAFILGAEKTHYRTSDQGKSWQSFHTDAPPSNLQNVLSFNAKNPDLILFAGEYCDDKGTFWGQHCYDYTYYSQDGLKTTPTLLRKNTHSCIFARSTQQFKEASEMLILCIDEDNESSRKFPMNLRLVSSDDGFKSEKEVLADSGPLRGVVGLGTVQTFIVAATKSTGTDEMALYITDDGITWDLAEFPDKELKEDAYTILESRPYGIQVDVMSSDIQYNSFGALYMSNSNGTYFTKNLDFTNRNELGIVDFENVENVEGIVLANVVHNHADVSKNRNAAKQLQSRISFNDGRDWQPLKAPADSHCDPEDSSECSLHLYSAAAPHNVGRIFSSTTPGLLMGVGSVGSYLLPYTDCNLYISDDAGATWRMSRKDAHKYEWGDQGSILVAVYDEDTTDKLYYSFNRGQDWKTLDLGMKVRARILTTVPDSTTEKFTLVASRGKGEDSEANVHVFAIDFTGVRSAKCKLDKGNAKSSDFEKWYARYDSKGEPACLMGHKQFFWRKKADRNCYVGEVYHEPEPKEEDCPCTAQDYECDYNFVKDGKDSSLCVPAKTPLKPAECQDGKKTYSGPSGYRIIPGNTCDKKKGLSLDDPVERECDSLPSTPVAGPITSKITDFEGHARQYFYLERTEASTGSDETIIMQLDIDTVYKSHDHGETWVRILEGEEIIAIIPHRYFKDWVYFLTPSRRAFVSKDRAKSQHHIEMPSAPNNLRKQVLDFHSTKSSWLLYIGTKGCERGISGECRAVAYYTEDGGSSWDELHEYVDSCQYIGTTKVEADADLIYCTVRDPETRSGDLQLISSIDYFGSTEKLFESVVGFAVFEEFVVVAEVFEDTYLRMHASIDGRIFAHAHFPPKFEVDQQQAYTVLDSVTKSIFLHVTTNPQIGREWGSILKSNSNGTYFVTSVDFVNRNSAGYVDFEKLMGLEGVAIINVVDNGKDVSSGGVEKRLKTKMTHNDGGQWSYLTPPKKDSEGKAYTCSGDLQKCSLNLHGYTERVDIRDTYSSGSAIGILLGVGNVGEHLLDYESGNTFMSNDGGITWTESHKSPYQWEFGDQGSIVVMVKDGEPTDRVLYTLDEGRTWEEHIFAGDKMYIRDITTVPADNSRKFLLLAKPDNDDDEMKTISLDFSGLTDRQCKQISQLPNLARFAARLMTFRREQRWKRWERLLPVDAIPSEQRGQMPLWTCR